MANEEEMESFHISEKDLYDAFQPGQHQFHRLTKDQQIYGVFGNDEESGHIQSTHTGRQNVHTKSKNYSTPVDFVKGGIQDGSQSQKGNISHFASDEKGESLRQDKSSSDDEERFGNIAVPTKKPVFGKSISCSSREQKLHSLNKFNQQTKTSANELGEWEKHTKGIGAKLLFQMGYEPGKGLGKSLQGRSQPIEAHVRRGRGAIGIYGSEKKSEADVHVSDKNNEKEYFQQLAHWKRDLMEPSVKKQKTLYLYRTTEDVIEEMSKNSVHKMAREYSEISKAKVIDMTGREQRVLQGYSALRTKKTEEPTDYDFDGHKKDKFQLEKLCFNLDTLVDHCEHEIVQNAKELLYNQEQASVIESQVKSIGQEVLKEKTRLEMLSSMLAVFDDLEVKHAGKELNLDFLWEKIQRLDHLYPDEYLTSDIANISLTYLIPLVKMYLSAVWRPFESKSSDEACRLLFQRWRSILEFRDKSSTYSSYETGFVQKSKSDSRMDPYHGLLWHAWMPAFRGLVGQWICKNANPMVDLIESWKLILPNWIMDNILDQLILPRIQKEVDTWNPLTDLVPIHAWIHPWLPRLGTKMEIVYPNIRHKMAQALVTWTPSDQSARSVLLPWVPVFSKGAMDAFLLKNIVPKLQQAILSWDINPTRQELDVWHWVMNWKELLPTQSLIQLLVSHFFPKWLQVLVTWLNHHPNYEEIVVWYTGWKALFPQDIAENSAIEEQFTRALDLMNRSLAVGGQVEFTPSAPIMATTLHSPVAEPVVPHGLRELVEYRCAQLGILCIPLVNRFHAGRPIFRIGNVLCHFDRQVAFVLANNVWTPITVQQLLDMATSS